MSQIIRLQKKEIEQKNEYIKELQNELVILREKANVINTLEITR